MNHQLNKMQLFLYETRMNVPLCHYLSKKTDVTES